jgi:hypothetical protein
MSTSFQIDYTSIGLKLNYLYEILATTFSNDNNIIVPNTASMGVRLVDKRTLKIWPFPSTSTYKNIEESRLLALNFVDNVYFFALASLKGFSQHSQIESGFSKDNFSYYTLNINKENLSFPKSIAVDNTLQIPYLKQAWSIIICYANEINQILKKDDFGEYNLKEVSLTIISFEKLRESFKLFNRAENIALETIILSTKLKVALEKKEEPLIRKIKNKIEENISDVKRFGKNVSALKAIEHIEGYIKGLES